MTDRPPHIVIVGGGSSGSEVGRTLARQTDPPISITLIDPQDHQIYPPSLIRCLGRPDAVPYCWRLSQLVKGTAVTYLKDRVDSLSLSDREVHLSSQRSLSYDHVVLALGSEPQELGTNDLRHYLFHPLTLGDLHLLRERLIDIVDELADAPDEIGRILILGGGSLGVEIAAECALLRRDLARSHRIPLGSLKLELVERGGDILPEYLPATRQAARVWLEEHGVELKFKTHYDEEDLRALVLIPHTIGILAAGRRPHRIIHDLPLRHDRQGYLIVDEFLRAHGTERVWVVGDVASHPHRGHHTHAVESGRRIAHHLTQTLSGRPLEHLPSHPLTHPRTISLGPRDGILEYGQRSVRGPIARFVRGWQQRRHLGSMRARDSRSACPDCLGSRLAVPHNVS